jgi:hypothetical protein
VKREKKKLKATLLAHVLERKIQLYGHKI